MHPSASLEFLGEVYGSKLKGVRTAGRSELDIAEAISRIQEEFDCFVIQRSFGVLSGTSRVISAIAQCTRGWVEVFGVGAEELHDAIDEASVKIGRQTKIGDGAPMTTWNLEMGNDALIEYISTGGQGESSLKLILYSGDQSEEKEFFARLRDRLAGRQ